MTKMPSLGGIFRRISLYSPMSLRARNADDFVVTTLRGNSTDQTSIVWLLDNTASRDPSDPSKWRIDLVAAFFAARTGNEIAQAVADVSAKLGLADDAAERKLVEQRVRPFFLAVLPERACDVQFGEDTTSRRTINKTDAGGVSRTYVALDGPKKDGQVVPARVIDDSGIRCLNAHTTFAKEEGWAVISDIDDTIKKTLTDSPTGILETTFAQQPETIKGQPEFYKYMSERLDGPPFWYLSASPYNLYAFLHEFRDAHFPPGTILLRNTSWQNVAGFLASLTKDTRQYKIDKMEGIHTNFPSRRFICIGDSTQSDPEAYAEMYHRYPDWIKRIFIRKVDMVAEIQDILPGQGNEERNNPERFRKAFKNVPNEVWYVFEEPQELYEKLDGLIEP